MKISQDVRDYSKKQGITEDVALQQGMQEKSIEFIDMGAQIYNKT
jgi:phosphomethylpyrimidine synthase